MSVMKIVILIILLVANLSSSQTHAINSNDDLQDYFVPGFNNFDQSWDDWVQDWYRFLSQSETPWMNVWGTLRDIEGQYDRDENLTPNEVSEKDKKISTVFGKVESDLYSLVALASACNYWDYKEKCREYDVYKKIIALDSENVLAYMIPVSIDQRQYYGSNNEIAIKADIPEIRQLIIKASNSTVWEYYGDKAALEYYRANLDFVRQNPPPTEEQRRVPDYVIAFMKGDSAPLNPFGDMDKINILCEYYENIGDLGLTTACSKLATILRENHWEKAYWMESNQQRRADPFHPDYLYSWRKALIFIKVKACLKTRWLEKRSQWPTLNRAVFENFVFDITHYGRCEAMKNASIAEYDSYPSLYTLDPRECESMLELTSSEMGKRLGNDDALNRWLENQKRILETNEYANHVATDESMLAEVEKLETIEDVGDPLVEHLGSHGEAVEPYVLEKLCSSRQFTSLSAAWALSYNPNSLTLLTLLEVLAEARNSGKNCEAVQAITMIMERLEPQLRKPEAGDFASDFDALLYEGFCEINEDEDPLSENSDSEIPMLVVFSKNVTNSRAVECEFRPLEARPGLSYAEINKWAKDNVYNGLTIKILDLPKLSRPMSAFESHYGSPPLALANVFRSWRNGGVGQLWVKTEKSWVKIQDTYSIIE